jgi:hypothetical protein
MRTATAASLCSIVQGLTACGLTVMQLVPAALLRTCCRGGSAQLHLMGWSQLGTSAKQHSDVTALPCRSRRRRCCSSPAARASATAPTNTADMQRGVQVILFCKFVMTCCDPELLDSMHLEGSASEHWKELIVCMERG